MLSGRFSALYRAACADLALADAYQLPAETVRYLHQLVGRAHKQLYRSRSFNMSTWLTQLFDRCLHQDHEFERLRDYTIDDNNKHIDWRATARRRKLTVRDYQSSQSQRIIFLLDCGRMMTNQIERYLRNLVGRHLPLGVLLRDRSLFDAVDYDPSESPIAAAGDKRFWRAAAAADILSWRKQVITDLEGKGVLSLDVFPESMTAPLVNRYLEIKARHLH